jgi:hypothetical protein
MHRDLPWSCSKSAVSTGAGSGGSVRPYSAESITNVQVWDANMDAMYGVQRNDKLHAYAQFTHTNLFYPFTTLPLPFLYLIN